MTDAEHTFTDLDGYVTLHVNEGAITVEVSVPGFSQPPAVLAALLTELASRLPDPGAAARDHLAASAEAIGRLRQAAAEGGYEAFAAMMRGRLGIDEPQGTLSRDPEFDRAIANRLDGVLDAMRAAQAPRPRPAPEVLTVEVRSAEGDLVVASSTERAVARVEIGAGARRRGPDGLGRALTALIAEAREELRRAAEARAREEMPDSHVKAVDTAPEIAEKTGKAATMMTDRIMRMHESLNRKADGR